MFFQLPMYNQSSKDWKDISYFNIPDGDQLKNMYLFATSDVLIPLISVLGLAGNFLSMLILYKNGLKKCSNILIFYLAIADTIYLLGSNNIPLEIYLNINIRFGYFIAESEAYFLYCLFHVFVLMETVGKVVSMLLPTLIIAERFTAVYFPLHFSRIFTVNRVRISAVALFPLGVPMYILFNPLSVFVYTLDPASNETVGLIFKSRTYASDSHIFTVVSEVYSTVCGPCCVGFVSLGCVLISARIRLQLRERKSMSISGNASVARLASSLFPEHSTMTLHDKTSHKSSVFDFRKEKVIDETRSYPCKSICSLEGDNVTFQRTLSSFKGGKFPQNNTFAKNNTLAQNNTFAQNNTIAQNSAFAENNRRENPTSVKPRHRKRTTQILLSVCVVYSLTGTFNFLCDLAFNSRDLPYNTSLMIHRTGILVLCVNSAANFIIYVVFNKNFRETYRQLVCRCL